MKVKRFVLCLFMLTLIGGICFISCGNTSKAKAESDVAAETAEETFQSFLKKFTSSASFQYTRVKFPLKTMGIVKRPSPLLRKNGRCWMPRL